MVRKCKTNVTQKNYVFFMRRIRWAIDFGISFPPNQKPSPKCLGVLKLQIVRRKQSQTQRRCIYLLGTPGLPKWPIKQKELRTTVPPGRIDDQEKYPKTAQFSMCRGCANGRS